MNANNDLIIQIWMDAPPQATHYKPSENIGQKGLFYKSEGYRVLQTNRGSCWDIAHGVKDEDLSKEPFSTPPHCAWEHLKNRNSHQNELIRALRKQIDRYEFLIDGKMKDCK